jgi:hypothetical protein
MAYLVCRWRWHTINIPSFRFTQRQCESRLFSHVISAHLPYLYGSIYNTYIHYVHMGYSSDHKVTALLFLPLLMMISANFIAPPQHTQHVYTDMTVPTRILQGYIYQRYSGMRYPRTYHICMVHST